MILGYSYLYHLTNLGIILIICIIVQLIAVKKNNKTKKTTVIIKKTIKVFTLISIGYILFSLFRYF